MTGDRPVRVVVASRIYAPEPAAAAFRLRAMVEAVASRGGKVDVLTARLPRTMAEQPPTPGVRIRRFPVLRDRNDYVRGYLQYLSFDVPLALRLLTVRRPDVVVVEPPPTTGAVVRAFCAIRRVPYVAYLPDVWSDGTAGASAPSIVVKVVRAFERFTLRGAARIIAVTPEIAARAEALAKVPSERIVTIRNGIDTDVFAPDGAIHPDAPDGPYAVYAGTVSEWQGADVFLRAWPRVRARVPGATLVYLGHGTGEGELKRVRESLGDDDGASVRLLPLVPAGEASAWQRGASAALVSMRPGQDYDYFLPTKIFAGAASGAPILYSGPGPGARLVTEFGLGRAVGHDVGQVAEALSAMLTAPVTKADRRRLADWVHANARVQVAGARAADVVMAVARRRSGAGGGHVRSVRVP